MADNKMPVKDNQPSNKLAITFAKQYHFDIKALFSRANGLAKANFFSLFQASLVLFLTFVVLGLFAQQFVTFNDDGTFVFEHQSLIEIGAIFIVAPLIAGLYMMGVRHARGEKTTVFSLFSYLSFIFAFALTQLVNGIVVQIGLVLLIVPGVYLWMATSFSLMLVADKSLTPLRAIILSCRVFNAYWAQLTGVFAIFIILFFTVPLTFGLSLIWVLPLYFSMLGLLYEELIGEEGEQTPTQHVQNKANESSFDA
ncbi:stress protein [Alteromonas sp. 1_MG-2023]|uniref:stress protein n=1 Tax=Alteromonas sp. 1_MG-2023 TaxID=3062669 RepID=UPI0026E37182|nr:stress protein [Alteromonas sp. 1_MG-2023]MDO6565841.1 stress protein [Alteromonas sp. 1_MG-2023]